MESLRFQIIKTSGYAVFDNEIKKQVTYLGTLKETKEIAEMLNKEEEQKKYLQEHFDNIGL